MSIVDKYIKPLGPKIAAGLSVKTLGTLAELLLPYILSTIVDDLVPTKDIPAILWMGLWMIVCAFLALVCNIWANRSAARVSADMTRNIRHDLFEADLSLYAKQVDKIGVPSLESRITADTYNLHQMASMWQRMGIRAPIIIIGGFVMMLKMDVGLAMILLYATPLLAFLVYLRAGKGIRLYNAVQQANDDLTLVVRENAGGIRVIKALSRVEYETEHFEKVNETVRAREIRANKTMAIVSPGMDLILNTALVTTVLYGAYRVYNGLSQAGVIIGFLSYFTMISRAFMAIGRIFIMSSKGSASAKRIEEVLSCVTEGGQQGLIPQANEEPVIEFNDVSFSYQGKRNAISHLSFRLYPGESLGLLGATGSGKTTVLSLLLRFYEVDSGEIKVFGRSIKEYDARALRALFGTVMQNDFVFSGSIRDNVIFGRDENEEDLLAAVCHAQADEFVSNLDKGLAHKLNINASNLSGGQRQRVLLSRALYGQRAALLLDDSSSALDYKTDSKVRKVLDKDYAQCAKLIIAQRISSVRSCDRILLLEQGEVVAQGNDASLMESSELYRAIARSQMGGALFE